MHFRAIRKGDVDACAAMLPRSGAGSGVAPGSLAALWRELLQEERISGGVVVEPRSERVLAFGLTAFVDETFLADYLAAPKPYLSARLYDGVRSRRSLLLDPLDVGHANEAGALNFVILHFHLAPHLEPAVGQGAVAAAEAGSRLAHGGYRVRRMLQEAHGPHELAMLTGAGLRLKSDYSDYFAAPASLGRPPASAPSSWASTPTIPRAACSAPQRRRCSTAENRGSFSLPPSSECSRAPCSTSPTKKLPARSACRSRR